MQLISASSQLVLKSLSNCSPCNSRSVKTSVASVECFQALFIPSTRQVVLGCLVLHLFIVGSVCLGEQRILAAVEEEEVDEFAAIIV